MSLEVYMWPVEVGVIDRVLKSIGPDIKVLEWGSGGSTVRFSQFCETYHSVEHNKSWYRKVKSEMPDNVQLHYIPPNELGMETMSRFSGKGIERWEDLYECDSFRVFEDYILKPREFEDRYDVVLIDGRARPQCARAIYDRLDEDSVVFIHDWFDDDRDYYWSVLDRYEVIDSINFTPGERGLVGLRKK